jgi:hypothetical protein
MEPSIWADILAVCLFVVRQSPILAFLFLMRSAIVRRSDERLGKRIEKLKEELEAMRAFSRFGPR